MKYVNAIYNRGKRIVSLKTPVSDGFTVEVAGKIYSLASAGIDVYGLAYSNQYYVLEYTEKWAKLFDHIKVEEAVLEPELSEIFRTGGNFVQVGDDTAIVRYMVELLGYRGSVAVSPSWNWHCSLYTLFGKLCRLHHVNLMSYKFILLGYGSHIWKLTLFHRNSQDEKFWAKMSWDML